MKNALKLLPLLALLGFCGVAQAQTVPAKPNGAKKMVKVDHMKSDHMMMHDGKMMVMKNGVMTPMTADMTLANGTRVMTDGTVTMKLKENQLIGMDGKMHDGSQLHSGMSHNAKKKPMKAKM
ncbi:DUF6799 domain-containing protein [Hymenobacter algoricola]